MQSSQRRYKTQFGAFRLQCATSVLHLSNAFHDMHTVALFYPATLVGSIISSRISRDR
jgi:hypothetical protein